MLTPESFARVGKLVTEEYQHRDETGKVVGWGQTTVVLCECPICFTLVQALSRIKHIETVHEKENNAAD